MPRNGSGGYDLPTNSWNPAVNGASATSTDYQALINDVETAIQQSVSADGQTPITGDFNFGGYDLLNFEAESDLINFTPAGTGAVATTVQELGRRQKHVFDFFTDAEKADVIAGTMALDLTSALGLAKTYAAASAYPVELLFPAGRYEFSTSPDWDVNNLTLTPLGNVELKCTGTGPALNVNGAAAAWLYGLVVKDGFTLTGNAATTQIFVGRRMAHCTFGKMITREGLTYGFNVELAVLCTFNTPSCSINEQAMTTVPSRGFRLASYTGLNSTANTIINAIMEGPSIGVDCSAADFNTFVGGTAEACTTHGVIVNAGSKGNKFITMSCEANGTTDILDQGDGTIIEGGYFTKLINFVNADRPTLRNAQTHTVLVDASTDGATVEDITVSSFTSGGFFSPLGTNLSKKNVYNKNLSTFDTGSSIGRNPTSAMAALTVGASPYTHTNNAAGFEENVIVRGGTVTQIEIIRNSVLSVVGGGGTGLPTAGVFNLMPGDGLKVAYAVLPEMIRVPK